MLNNVRMDHDEASMKGDSAAMADTQLVQRLSSVADMYVNDAFACAHRSTPSIVGFASMLPCVAGELMGNELRKLDMALETPKRPCLAVLGGIKVDDSIQVADNMLRNGIADALWPTGGVANLLLIWPATTSVKEIDRLMNEMGKNAQATVQQARTLVLDHGDKIHLPVDLAANIEGNRVDIPIDKFPLDAPFQDIGINSVFHLSAAIKQAGTIILNGPAGVFESTDFALGTVEMLNACAESPGYAVMGGGHTATLVAKNGTCWQDGPCFHRRWCLFGLHRRSTPFQVWSPSFKVPWRLALTFLHGKPMFEEPLGGDSNSRPSDYESDALPTKPQWRQSPAAPIKHKTLGANISIHESWRAGPSMSDTRLCATTTRSCTTEGVRKRGRCFASPRRSLVRFQR